MIARSLVRVQAGPFLRDRSRLTPTARRSWAALASKREKLDAVCRAPRDPRPRVSELHHELAGVLPVEQHVDCYGQLLESVDDGLLRLQLALGHPPGELRDD